MTFWKLTRYGFMSYSEGRFYYEDNFFSNMISSYDIFGNFYINSLLNGYLDFRMTPYYHNIYSNMYTYFSPSPEIVPLNFLQNINIIIPVFTALKGPANHVPAVNNNLNIHPPGKLSLATVSTQIINEAGERKYHKFDYEKTQYGDVQNVSGYYDIRNEFSLKNNYGTNNYSGKNTNPGSNIQNVNRSFNGSKTTPPANKQLSKSVKKSD